MFITSIRLPVKERPVQSMSGIERKKQETGPSEESAPAEAAADIVPIFKSLAECFHLNQAGMDVSEHIDHHLKEATDEYGELGAECADLYFLLGDNLLRGVEDIFEAGFPRKSNARVGKAPAASVSASATASSAAVPDLEEVNELVGTLIIVFG